MKFEIEEKIHELTEGYLMILIKYAVVFFLAWMVGILIVFTYPCFVWNGDKYPPALEFINDYNIITWILAGISFYLYTVYLLKISKNGLIVEFDFDDEKEEVSLKILNTLTGKIQKNQFSYSDFKVNLKQKQSKLYGLMRVYNLFSRDRLISKLNIDLTAWKKHSNIEMLLTKLNGF